MMIPDQIVESVNIIIPCFQSRDFSLNCLFILAIKFRSWKEWMGDSKNKVMPGPNWILLLFDRILRSLYFLLDKKKLS